MLHRLSIILALFAVPALAQDYNRQDVIRGLCARDGCDEFTILATERLTTTTEGTLLKTRIQTFHASANGRKERGQDNGYVYCSRTKPALMAEHDGKVMAFFLAPFTTKESRESVRKNSNYHALYFTICHGREAGQAAMQNLSGVAQSHDYRVSLARSKAVALKRAEEVISPTRRPAEPGRTETHEHRATQAARNEGSSIFAGARRLTNRAFDALDGVAGWVVGDRSHPQQRQRY